MTTDPGGPVRELKFRDPAAAAALARTIARTIAGIGRPRVTLMHVCGSHEQAIARFGLRSALPPHLLTAVSRNGKELRLGAMSDMPARC